ncbi:MAG: hypothetical protein U0984_12960, partial [Prosthecobacter sp.]|nr:hypothetical protein [Prosthecobacter sp.]
RDHEYTPAVADHEKTLARVLVCLCNAAESGDHQFNSAQCDSNTGTERGASSRVVKHAPPVNLAATFQLARITLHPARDTTRTGGFPEGLLPRQGIRRALASVRLLI